MDDRNKSKNIGHEYSIKEWDWKVDREARNHTVWKVTNKKTGEVVTQYTFGDGWGYDDDRNTYY